MSTFFNSDKTSKDFVESKFMESYKSELDKALTKITKIFNDYNVNFTFIGGVARNEYASTRMTDDVDLLVSITDKDKIKEIPIGIMNDKSSGRLKVFNLHEPHTKVEIIYSGDVAGNKDGIIYLDPSKVSELHSNLPFLTIENLIMYKLSSGIYGKRYKDFGDIQDIVKQNKLPRNLARLNKFRIDLVDKYEEIWDDSKEDPNDRSNFIRNPW